MLTKLKIALASSFSVLALLVVPVLAVMPATVRAADIQDCLNQGTNLDGRIDEDCEGSDGAGVGETDLTSIITTIVNFISILVGVIAVIMIIWGGLKYITSGGDSGKITSAKNTIIYAVIGLIVVALAQFIVRIVLSRTGDVLPE